MPAVCREDSVKNKLDSLFSHMLFVPQASQSSFYRGQNLRFCPRFLRQKSIACGMGIKMAVYIITFILLIYESIVDIRQMKIDVRAAIIVFIFDIVVGLTCYGRHIESMAIGAIVGGLLIFLAWVSRQRIGYGDGIIFVVIGICMEPLELIGILWCSTLLAGIYGMIKIIVCKKGRDYKLPLIPFVTAAYAAMLAIT